MTVEIKNSQFYTLMISRIPASTRKIVALGVLILSAYYIFQVLISNFEKIDNLGAPLGMMEWLALILGSLGTQVLGTVYHFRAVSRLESPACSDARLGLAYALGQIVRYLPGKVFGVMFQISYLRGNVGGGSVFLALLAQTAYDYSWTVAFSTIVVLSFYLASLYPLLLLLPIIMSIWMLHSRFIAERLLARIPLLKEKLELRFRHQQQNSAAAAIMTALVLAAWLPLLLGCYVALGSLLGEHLPLILALYLFSAVVSLAVVVLPSGLVIREALFAYLGTFFGIDAALLIVVGLYIRIGLTLSEVLNVLVFGLWTWLDPGNPLDPGASQ
ncbi:MAG: hypothetical protein KDI71_21610 [Xanthomonadales bacterium]|nr:hypothetical protein [Xanthomonadales bacterium]